MFRLGPSENASKYDQICQELWHITGKGAFEHSLFLPGLVFTMVMVFTHFGTNSWYQYHECTNSWHQCTEKGDTSINVPLSPQANHHRLHYCLTWEIWILILLSFTGKDNLMGKTTTSLFRLSTYEVVIVIYCIVSWDFRFSEGSFPIWNKETSDTSHCLKELWRW